MLSQKSNPNPKCLGTAEAYFPPVDLHWFFEISIRTEKKIQLELKKKFSYKLTEIFFQFEINAKMDISKN